MSVHVATGYAGAPPIVVFDEALSARQFAGLPDWHPSFRRQRLRILRPADGAGLAFEFELPLRGATAHGKIIEHARPWRVVSRFSGGIFEEATVTWSLVPEGASGTMLTYCIDYHLRGWLARILVDGLMLRPRLVADARAQIAAVRARAEAAVAGRGAA